MRKLLSMIVLLVISWSSIAATSSGPSCSNTFVKQVTGIGNREPRIFKDPASPNFFLTSVGSNNTYISGVNAAGTLTWTHRINFSGDVAVIRDLVVDQVDGTLAGVAVGNSANYVFKYNYTTSSFDWLKRYPVNYLFRNIHQQATGDYIVTGEILNSNITIFEVDRNTGAFGSFQNEGNPFTGEFYSTYDGNNIYGACRYYSSPSLFNPSMFEFSSTGINNWTSTYIQTAGPVARIYPVAPIVDKSKNTLLQLSSGDDAGFNTYLSGNTKIWLLETDMQGKPNWTNKITIPGYNRPNVKKIINTATGYYLLTDVYNGSMEDYFFVIKTDKNGKVQWSNRYGMNGFNSVISGVEDNGYLYLTAVSQSYSTTTGREILFLKLDPNGLSGGSCPYIQPWNAYEKSYANTLGNKPTGEAPTAYSNADHTASMKNQVTSDKVHCSTTCPTPPPCNTFVKQVTGIGNLEPRIFKDPASPNFFLTSADNQGSYISGVNASGTLTWTHQVRFLGDVGIIKDLVVDQVDGTLAGIVAGNNYTYYTFKYNYVTASFDWIQKYPANCVLFNIHQVAGGNYIVTGAILYSNITIFEVDRNTGAFGSFQNQGNPFTGEFFSTYDGNNIYGACRYYSSPSLFNPSMYEFSSTGINNWTSTYIQNAGPVARIYPVAPIVDIQSQSRNLLQLSSGDDAGFNTYLSGNTKMWLLETDMQGNLKWTNEIIIPGYQRPNVKKIINTATGYYLLTDVYNGNIEDYFFVIKTDKNGKVQWSNRYGISGLNTVISGVEDNGYLYLTAMSQSYSANREILFLKLDPNGLSDANCPYIKHWNALDKTYGNTQVNKPIGEAPTGFSNTNHTALITNQVASDKVHCATTCAVSVPCSTLSGPLAANVMAFYPFGNGSLLDLSGNGNHLNNGTSAYPTKDRDGNPDCAYHFERTNGDFLDGPGGFVNNITTGSFSVSLWYQPTNDPTRGVGVYEQLLGRDNTGLHCPDTWGEWSVGLYDCRKAVVGFDQYSHWETNPSGNCAAVMSSISNMWHHLAFVYDLASGGTSTLYVDGTPYMNNHGPCGPMSGNIGQLILGSQYTGDLDDVIIYNKALSASEVNTLKALKGSCCDGVSSTVKKAPLEKASGLKVYPNPTDGRVSVSSSNGHIRQVNVYTNTGVLAGTYMFDAAEVSVNLDQLAPGMYFIKVTTGEGTFTEKVIRR